MTASARRSVSEGGYCCGESDNDDKNNDHRHDGKNDAIFLGLGLLNNSNNNNGGGGGASFAKATTTTTTTTSRERSYLTCCEGEQNNSNSRSCIPSGSSVSSVVVLSTSSSAVTTTTATTRSLTSVRRRTSMPSELEDPEDFTIGIDPDVDDDYDYDYDYHVHETETDALVPPPAAGPDEGGEEKKMTTTKAKATAAAQQRFSALPKELRNLVAGGIAGMVAKSVVAPLDRIKILYQVTNAKFSLRKLPLDASRIIQNEGWSALWKGNTATMIRVVPYSGIQFMAFDKCKTFYLKQHHNLDGTNQTKYGLTPKESLIAGMVAGTVSSSSTYPLDLARAQLAVLRRHTDGSHSTNLQEVLRENYARRGVPGLYRGISVTLVGILPYSGVAFALNEQGKREIRHITGRDVTTIERLQCGAFAGLVAQTITYPIEVVRRRMQTLGIVANNDTAFNNIGVKVSTTTATSLVEPPPTSSAAATATTTRVPSSPPTLVNTVRSLYLEQGPRGFFKGVAVNWMKGPVAFSISFTTYDHVQKLMETEYEQQNRRSISFRR